jgi:hypothetical protein
MSREIWTIVEQETGGERDWFLLGEGNPDDEQRIGVTVTSSLDGPVVDALVVYPCGTCGWAGTCGEEECHV